MQKLRRGLNKYGPGAIGLIAGFPFVYEIGLAYITCENCNEIYRNPFLAAVVLGPFVLVLIVLLAFHLSYPPHERGHPIQSALHIVYGSLLLGFFLVLGLPFAFLGTVGLPTGHWRAFAFLFVGLCMLLLPVYALAMMLKEIWKNFRGGNAQDQGSIPSRTSGASEQC